MPSANFWVGPYAAPDTYRLISLLGGGGEGEVWQAVLPLSTEGRRQVAVKILRGSGRPDEAAQWSRTGHLLQSLTHPGLVRVTEVFIGSGMHRAGEPTRQDEAPFVYVVMDYIEGPTLREWCDENPDATAATRLRMLRMVASALDEMHSGATTEVPVAHSDIKPSKVDDYRALHLHRAQ
ncbi:MAG: protein kinase domain-containing protein [Pseudonocardiaceae bacterium]